MRLITSLTSHLCVKIQRMSICAPFNLQLFTRRGSHLSKRSSSTAEHQYTCTRVEIIYS